MRFPGFDRDSKKVRKIREFEPYLLIISRNVNIIHGSYIKLNPGVKGSAILLRVLSRLREMTNTSLQFTPYVK